MADDTIQFTSKISRRGAWGLLLFSIQVLIVGHGTLESETTIKQIIEAAERRLQELKTCAELTK